MSLLTDTPQPQTQTETADARATRLSPEHAANAARLAAFYAPGPAHVLERPTAAVQVVRDTQAVTRTLYDPAKSYGKTEDSHGNRIGLVRDAAIAIHPEVSDAQLSVNIPELATMFVDAGLTAADVSHLTSVIRANRANPMNDDQAKARRLEAVAALRQEYSTKGRGAFDRALADAMALAKRDPRFGAILDKTNAGSDKRLVLRLAELGREQRQRGLLK